METSKRQEFLANAINELFREDAGEFATEENRVLPVSLISLPSWLTLGMQEQAIVHWGAADLGGFSTPKDAEGRGFPRALSWAIPITPQVMAEVCHGPTQAYADEYDRINRRINELAGILAAAIRSRGFRAQPLAASERSDPVNIKGDFPHKTAATRAGLGWIGRHCQLVTRRFGSWIRLGTVFTDMDLPCGPPMERSFCGRCTAVWMPALPER